MTIAGVPDRRPLQIDLWSRGAEVRVAIDSRRPVHAARIFLRRSVDEVLELLPRLFSICGVAQARAARTALSLATGRDLSDEKTASESLLFMETAREHLWRVLIDWPAFLGAPASKEAVTAMRSLVPQLQQTVSEPPVAAVAGAASLDALLSHAVFGLNSAEWLALEDREALEAWCQETDTGAATLLRHLFASGWESIGCTTPHFLPLLSVADLNKRLSEPSADAFVERPEWDGHACETTPLSRGHGYALVERLRSEHGAGLLTRLVALLAELADLPRRLRRSAGSTGAMSCDGTRGDVMPPDVGIAQLDAARGRLVHRAVVDDDRIVSYQIVAPTEWNFHPRGALADSLRTLDAPDPDELRRQAELLAMTIDPCVDFSVGVH